ncbi:MAG TPA: hypothetical protein VLW53_15365, partial [Candidatus Eisenbacteria bacterium]|nr:hypothetical protein [Candidatus Eisenbacteria bacterium]
MSPALSALVVVLALSASAALLVRLAVTESRRAHPVRPRPHPVGPPASPPPLSPPPLSPPPLSP